MLNQRARSSTLFTYIIMYPCWSSDVYFQYIFIIHQGSSWSWSYVSWVSNYLCNQYLSPLTLWVRIPLRRDVLDTTLHDKVCQWLETSWWFSPGTPVSSTNKTNRFNITEILLKVALITTNQTYLPYLLVRRICLYIPNLLLRCISLLLIF